MHNSFTIILLSVALLLAVGVLVWRGCRVIYGIAHYYLRERKPVRKIEHPQLGMLTSQESDVSLWMGETSREGQIVPFVLGGGASAPDEQLVAQLQKILACYSAFVHQAVEFLRSREPELRGKTLNVYMIDLSDERHFENFTIEFVNSADDSRI